MGRWKRQVLKEEKEEGDEVVVVVVGLDNEGREGKKVEEETLEEER